MSTDAGTFAHLGDTIVVLRHLRGLSQAELAARAGIRPNHISRYETGQVLPQLGQLEKLLRALDVGLPELVFAMDHLARTAPAARGARAAAGRGAAPSLRDLLLAPRLRSPPGHRRRSAASG